MSIIFIRNLINIFKIFKRANIFLSTFIKLKILKFQNFVKTIRKYFEISLRIKKNYLSYNAIFKFSSCDIS